MGFLRTVLSLSICSILFAGGPAGAVSGDAKDAANSAETKVLMHGIFSSIKGVLPLSMNDKQFYEPKNRQKIQTSLDQLARYAGNLQEHAQSKDKSFAFVSRSLEQDAKDVAKWFRQERFDEARYMLHNITENCISCHTKVTSQQSFPGVESLFADVNLETLSQLDRARLQIATRQFDSSLNTFETLILTGQLSPSDLVFLDVFSDYLKVSIRVKGDYGRARKTLESYRAKRKLPHFVEVQVTDWIDSLRELQQKDNLLKGPDLEVARRFWLRAQKKMKYPKDRDGLVFLIVASGKLNAFIAEGKAKPEELAEAYYMAGFIEELIGRSFWVSQSEFMLESAIRTAPTSPFARDAYTLLEEHVYLDYSGSSGTHIPDDVAQRLSELKKMIPKQ